MDTAQKIVCDLAGLGMNDSQIADAVESSQPTIWRIRTGETQSCRSDLYLALADLRTKEQARRCRRRTDRAPSRQQQKHSRA